MSACCVLGFCIYAILARLAFCEYRFIHLINAGDLTNTNPDSDAGSVLIGMLMHTSSRILTLHYY